MREIDVRIMPAGAGYVAEVAVRDGGRATRHRVRLPAAALEQLAPGADPAALVRRSFEFLLEREPQETILREFEIDVIPRYFPEYPKEIRRRLTE
ncbi:MAG TPA: hypothetical protein VFY79_01265 [Dehalococcoidia bacterium]|jgi:hypothetical protein|nr:hypothetical protein [Dehalococcoidia bacterium]